MLIVTRFPVVAVDGTLVTVIVGKADVSFGDGVTLEAVFDRKTVEGLYVAGVDTASANVVAQDVLDLFALRSPEDLVMLLSRRYGTGLPSDVTVTVYTLVYGPVEELVFVEGED